MSEHGDDNGDENDDVDDDDGDVDALLDTLSELDSNETIPWLDNASSRGGCTRTFISNDADILGNVLVNVIVCLLALDYYVWWSDNHWSLWPIMRG